MKKCSSDCVPICGFCSKYNIENQICKVQNKSKKKYSDCNCNKFSCFTLNRNYNKNKYLDIKYILRLYEGEE
jgi:hypothetical protein